MGAKQRIELDFITPGSPKHNGFIESICGKLQDECLNMHWLESLAEAKNVIERWRIAHNEM